MVQRVLSPYLLTQRYQLCWDETQELNPPYTMCLGTSFAQGFVATNRLSFHILFNVCFRWGIHQVKGLHAKLKVFTRQAHLLMPEKAS
jgi:hypothetical protein